MSLVQLAAKTIGPVIAIVLFEALGNDWDVSIQAIVIYVGVAMECPVGLLCFCFRDKWVLEESDNQTVGTFPSSPKDAIQPNGAPSRVIPWLLYLSSFLVSLGGGLTLKFFPLYFKNEIGLNPADVQLIYAFVPITMLIVLFSVSALSSYLGRMPTVVVAKALGSAGIYLLGKGPAWFNDSASILGTIFIIRTALMNSTNSIESGLVSDLVPQRNSLLWKSLEGIELAVWSGSSALGGVLIEGYGYSFAIMITAYIQFAGVFILICLIICCPTIRKGF